MTEPSFRSLKKKVGIEPSRGVVFEKTETKTKQQKKLPPSFHGNEVQPEVVLFSPGRPNRYHSLRGVDLGTDPSPCQ